MRCFTCVTFTLGILLAAAPALADDEKKPDDKKTEKKEGDPKPAAKPEAKPKMVVVGQIQGRVTNVDREKKTVAIEVKIPYVQGQNVREHKETHEHPLAADFQVFWQQLPVEYDDKGKPKKPNPKDVQKPVKGPGGISGYPTESETLRRDQQVLAVFQQKKDATKPSAKKGKDSPENKPVVGAIYILYEPRK